MSNVKNWLTIIKNNDLRAYNKVNTKELAVCFNFIQVTDTNTVMITMSIMKNGVKKVSMSQDNYSNFVSFLEELLLEVQEEVKDKYDYDICPEYFESMRYKVSQSECKTICGHKVFFIPDVSIWDVIKHLFHQANINEYKEYGIKEVAVFINTDSYDFNGKFY